MQTNKYVVKIAPAAIDYLNAIYEYIASELCNPEAALNLIQNIEKSVLRLKAYPHSCSLVKDELLRIRGYRKLIVNNYIAFYICDDINMTVNIMRVYMDVKGMKI